VTNGEFVLVVPALVAGPCAPMGPAESDAASDEYGRNAATVHGDLAGR